ncbi:hypothetical protein [Alterinioella nitratireducens]
MSIHRKKTSTGLPGLVEQPLPVASPDSGGTAAHDWTRPPRLRDGTSYF